MINENILHFLADEYSRKILTATIKQECSARELAIELKIPSATLYRKIKSLEEAKLIKNVKTVRTQAGNDENYYRSTINKIFITFDGKLSITLVEKDLTDRFIKLWNIVSNRRE